MKVADLLEKRRQNWQDLERLVAQTGVRGKKSLGPQRVSRFAALYRAACADLALADAYQLPPNTVQYLHRLVGRAHNQLHRARDFNYSRWAEMLLVDAPQKIFQDRCVQLCFCLFWGLFLLSACFAYSEETYPGFAEQMLSAPMIEQLETNFSEPISGRDPQQGFFMASFYIQHNTGIGLKCFVYCLAVVPGLFITMFSSSFLGASFGYMARPDVPEGENFLHFVTAHGPFELTAIVLSAGAGLRIGLSWISAVKLKDSVQLTRAASLRKTAQETMPLMGSAAILFFLAALIEGFLSPSAAPYWLKATVAVASSGLLTFYFVVLGFPRRGLSAAR